MDKDPEYNTFKVCDQKLWDLHNKIIRKKQCEEKGRDNNKDVLKKIEKKNKKFDFNITCEK